tara:strand:- start:288 stop:503 length:216 start_codon:yes stop_codon:yes gene_type:complete
MPPLHEKLKDLEVPTLLVSGEHDQKFREIAEEMVMKLPRGVHRVISESGHATHLEQTDATATEILEHFGCT